MSRLVEVEGSLLPTEEEWEVMKSIFISKSTSEIIRGLRQLTKPPFEVFRPPLSSSSIMASMNAAMNKRGLPFRFWSTWNGSDADIIRIKKVTDVIVSKPMTPISIPYLRTR